MERPISAYNWRPVLKIVIIYALCGTLWIYLSDTILAAITSNKTLLTKIAVLKGLVYVSLTSLLLYALIIRYINRLRQAEEQKRKSEIGYSSLFDNMQEGYAYCGMIYDENKQPVDFVYIKINKSFERITGIKNAAGKRVAELIPGIRESSPELFERYGRVASTGAADKFEIYIDLLKIWFDVSVYSPEKDFFVAVFDDITARKNSEAALRASEERSHFLANVLEHASQPFAVGYQDGRIGQFNNAFLNLVGYTKEEIASIDWMHALTPPEWIDIERAKLVELTRTGQPVRYEKEYVRKNGTRVSVELLVHLIREKKGMPEYFYAFITDVTEQKKLQSQILQAQKNQSIGTLAGGIAHDFNNILAIVLAYSSALDRSADNTEKVREYSRTISQAVNRGATLVRQILTFARQTDIKLEPLNLPDLIHELISMLKQTFPKVISLIDIIDDDVAFINVDRTQVHQTLLNLCINARDAMPNGGSITIKAAKHSKDRVQERFPNAEQDFYICISVTDTGEGMDYATRQRIFDPFFTTKEQGKGTGLGLAVVYGVIQSHKGFIDVESTVGRGTTFRLYFPAHEIIETSMETPSVTESSVAGGTETVLLVEDEEALIQMVRFMLESKGYKVFTALDGKVAVNIYGQHKQEIDIVITDMGLPGLTGAEEFKKLKEIDPDVTMICASGFFEPDVKSELRKAGVKGFIQKPYEPKEILKIIREVLDNK
jgi:two-component system, cell cycle sensor histidine kinase and response regulator CckA